MVSSLSLGVCESRLDTELMGRGMSYEMALAITFIPVIQCLQVSPAAKTPHTGRNR